MKKQSFAKVLFLFLISYVLLFVLSVFSSVSGFGGWNVSFDLSRIDYFYALAPVCGFFLMFFLIDWVEKYFDTRFTRSPWFGLMVFVLAVIAYYVALFWFYCNLFSLAQTSVCSPEGANQTYGFLARQVPVKNMVLDFLIGIPVQAVSGFFTGLLKTEFVGSFLSSPYILFVLSVLFGWASKLFLGRLDK